MSLTGLLLLLGLLLTPQTAAAATDSFSSETVWDWYNHGEEVPALCGVSTWFELDPDEHVADAGCIEAAMRQVGASESAVQFFELTSQFLYSFDERGTIDFGFASSPWLNMGRGEAVLLNGLPSTMLMSQLVDDSWKTNPAYSGVLAKSPMAFPWVEYGGPRLERSGDAGEATVEATFEMRECRACATVANLRVAWQFDPSGYVTRRMVLPPT
jgi:hypothetical protein